MTTVSTLRDRLASQFDAYTVREQVRTGDRNTVYEVTVDGRRAACKLTETHPNELAREGAIQTAVTQRTPVSAPDVFAIGDGYLVMEWTAGQPYERQAEHDRRRTCLRKVGQILAQLHTATADWFTGHGTLAAGNDGLTVAEPTGWTDRFIDFVRDWACELRDSQYADVGTDVLETVTTHRACLSECSSVLIHGEISPDHVLFTGRRRPTLIDWELSQAAPGEFDLVWAERDLLERPVVSGKDTSFRHALIDEYRSERHLVSGFWCRRELYRAAFAMRELQIVTDPNRTVKTARPEHGASLQGFVYDRLAAASANSVSEGQYQREK